MFGNLNWTNVVILLLLALFIFGDKLPHIIADGLRLLRNLRRMAQNATTDLSRELGTDITLEDLHPKTFIRKHVLSEADQEALLKPLRNLESDFKEVGKQTEDVIGEVNAGGGARTARAARANRADNANRAKPVSQAPAPAEETPAPAGPPPVTYDDLP